jgi:asparagine synthase (glutamine-hydrolysing)
VCGIAGKLDFGGPVDERTVHAMCDAMVHRGPDSRGIHADDGVVLGVQRLAIIDVAHGDQPLFNEEGNVAVVLNGEIYNFGELRRDLRARGHRFRTGADTEVLVHLYEECGERLVDRLRGMYAFAIWDRWRRRLVLARDRVGKKPLYWARHGSRLWFASEVRALLQDPEIGREVDPRAIVAYLGLQYVPHPLCAFRRIRKLPPSTVMTVDAHETRQRRYWSLDYEPKVAATDARELAERLWEHLLEATRIRLVSEVPLGAFLSGGIDSSAVVAAMAHLTAEPVKTFSIGFPQRDYDELRYARMIAERYATEHHEFEVAPDAIAIMPKLARHYGEPYGDASAIPSFYLAQLTSRHVTVALNGDGGDESFAGYRRYASNRLAGRLGSLPRPLRRSVAQAGRVVGDGRRDASTRSRIRRLAQAVSMTPPERYAMWMAPFDRAGRNRILTPEFAAQADGWRVEDVIAQPWRQTRAVAHLDQMLGVDVATYLPADLLVKMDIATMAYSVEGRSPFLDQELMAFAAALPAPLKLRGLEGKRLLKQALRGRVPDAILRRPKMGFGVPLRDWFRNELRDVPEQVLLDPGAVARGYFRRDAVEQLIRRHRSGEADHATQLWVMLQLETWHREVVEGRVRPEPAVAARRGCPAPAGAGGDSPTG